VKLELTMQRRPKATRELQSLPPREVENPCGGKRYAIYDRGWALCDGEHKRGVRTMWAT
jgi:hypothetical protein